MLSIGMIHRRRHHRESKIVMMMDRMKETIKKIQKFEQSNESIIFVLRIIICMLAC